MRTDDPGFAEILRIPDLGNDREPLIAGWSVHQVIVLGEVRVRTIGDTVLAGVARAQTDGHDLQIAFPGLAASRDGKLPLSRRITLPTLLHSAV